METPLWAPWRMELILGEKPKGCIFCAFPAETNDREHLVLGRSARSFVMLNKFPYNNGHLLVLPRQHGGELTALADDAYADLQALLRASVAILQAAYSPNAMNVGMNLGAAAGAGIAEHLHWHVVPRWAGDNNFMPVIAETRVISEHLMASYDKLRPLFDAAL